MFKRNTSVASIMSSFTKQVAQLRALSGAKIEESKEHAERAAALRRSAVEADAAFFEANNEAAKADRMARKIEAFIEQ
jgi:hypothetical protein